MESKFNKSEYDKQYIKEHYSRIYIALKKNKVNKFKEICKEKGITQSSVIEKAIDDVIQEYDV